MTAKEYLLQLQKLDQDIRVMIDQATELHSQTGIHSQSMGMDRVQTSPQNIQENSMISYLDMEQKVRRKIDEYLDRKNTIIGQIRGLQNSKYARILYDKYVPDRNMKVKTLEEICVEMHYSYSRVCHMHGEALAIFARQYDIR